MIVIKYLYASAIYCYWLYDLRKLFNHFHHKNEHSDLPSLPRRAIDRLKDHSKRLDQSNDKASAYSRIPTTFIACLIHLPFTVCSVVLYRVACAVVKTTGSGFILPGAYSNATCHSFLSYKIRVVTEPTPYSCCKD